ncbi:divergent polysaccharide deacetylase family protein [Paenibacillus albidus]|uniref:divergent polysaccharide deacetylase family protein n=1 Tax=Paenibacillus albidus TaxID=2041023 RepID=UPI0020350621|nr:divergent polysaccharide deacetylase family protein [Paenibacillus albidus]
MYDSKGKYKHYLLYLLLPVLVIGVCSPAAEGNVSASAPLQAATSTQKQKKDSAATRSRVAIIIDDLGNGLRGTDEILSLPIKLTVAVMPFLSTTESDARRAHERGYDVLLHLPMEPRQGKPSWLGPGAILADMSDAEVHSRVEAALDNVPFAIGINNHMGSKVTGNERVMRIVLAVCKDRGLFYLDSKTNSRSVVGKIAREMGLPPVENHIFLDDTHSVNHVIKQLRLVGEKAEAQRYCVTIGHVGIQGKKTAAGIRSGIEAMKGQVDFVGISDLVREEWHWSPRPSLTFP